MLDCTVNGIVNGAVNGYAGLRPHSDWHSGWPASAIAWAERGGSACRRGAHLGGALPPASLAMC